MGVGNKYENLNKMGKIKKIQLSLIEPHKDSKSEQTGYHRRNRKI